MYCIRDVADYLSKVADFDPSHLNWPSAGVTPVEFRGDLWHHITKVPVVLFMRSYV